MWDFDAVLATVVFTAEFSLMMEVLNKRVFCIIYCSEVASFKDWQIFLEACDREAKE